MDAVVTSLDVARVRRGSLAVGLCLVILSLPILFHAPFLTRGIEHPRMVAHFDHDEFYVYRAWQQAYRQGPLYAGMFDANHYYPKLFYNLAGLVLYPAAQLSGGEVRVMMVVWRALNLLASLGFLLMLFFLVRRVFQSTVVGLLSGLLLALTPDFLWWSTNVRPHPLEQLFTLAGLYACIRLCERFTMRWFWWGASFGAAAFATKYGGAIGLVLLPATAAIMLLQAARDHAVWPSLLDEQGRWLARLSLPLIAVCWGVAAWWLILWWQVGGDSAEFFLALTRGAFDAEVMEKVRGLLTPRRQMLNVLTASGIVGMLLLGFVMGAVRMRWPAIRAGWRAPSWSMAMFFFLVFLTYTMSLYLAVLLATGLAYLIHPEHLVSHVGYMLYYIVLGGEHGQPGSVSLIESLRRTGLDMRRGCPGGWFLLPILGSALVAWVRSWRREGGSAVTQRQQTVLWAFVLSAVAIFLATKVQAVRHILVAMAVGYGLSLEVVKRLALNAGSRFRRLALGGCVGLAGLVIIANGLGAWDGYQSKQARGHDLGLRVGEWLRQRYEAQTVILTDYWPFYVPPTFTRALTSWSAMWREPQRTRWSEAVTAYLVAEDPDVIIVTWPRTTTLPVRLEPLFSSSPVLQHRGYHVVERFDPSSPYGLYDAVVIYERTPLRHPGRGARG